MTATTAARLRRWAPLLVVLAFAAVCALRASASRKVGGDFLRYHRAGRLVVTGDADRLYDVGLLRAQSVYAEERAIEAAAAAAAGRSADPFPEREFKYLPATAVLMAPFGALHPRTGWVLWGAWNGLLVGLTFLAAWRVCAQGVATKWFAAVAVVLLHAANDNLNLGQLNPSAIAPATLAIWALAAGRDRAAGLLAAFGGTTKFLPWFLAIWFAWKRRWTALAALLAGIALFAAALPAAVLGPSRSVALLGEYYDVRAHHYTGAAPPDLPGHSIKSFVYRVFGGVHYQSGNGPDEIDLDISIARADPQVLKWTVLALSVAALVVLLRPSRGPLRAAGDPRGPPEAGLFLAWLLLMSPEARAPHFLYLALPVTALVCGLVRARRDGVAGTAAPLALAIVGFLLLQTDSGTVVGDAAAARFSAWCSLGWGTLAVVAALWMLHRRLGVAASGPAR